ncbi:MAG: GNAT family N-acetyltransferase [Sphingobacteriaceae bacterium]|nr:GNAT family N-acetyltransferase [Sphingobacteriaceae bacterium]
MKVEQIPFYLTWKIRHEVMYPNLDIETVKIKNDENAVHFGVYFEDKLSSVLSLFTENESVQLRKFATLNHLQKKGLGTFLLKNALEYVKKQNSKLIWCNARVNAIDFYTKFGFQQTEQRFCSNGIDFVIMELKINDLK